MATSAPLIWAPCYTGSDSLVQNLCAVAVTKARVDLQATPFNPTDFVAWMAISPITAQRIRSWRLRQPWQQRLLGQPVQRE